MAFLIWRKGVTLSTQVVMEFTNVCRTKLKFPKKVAFENALNLLEGATVKTITESTIRLAFEISVKNGYTHWDSLIVASALEANYQKLYSEDMQHGHVIEGKLKIINPFL
ncbi:MAG: PIN domain-containing protein [Flammeovirgaceae bacterium]